MSEIEVVKEIRRFDNRPKIIVVTGYGSIESAVVAIRYGTWDYVQKAVETDVPLKKMKSALYKIVE